jgi:hypothetical protein
MAIKSLLSGISGAAKSVQSDGTPATDQLVIDSFKKIGSGRASYDVKTNQGDFYYFPSEYVTKGVKYNNYIYYDPQLLENDVLKAGAGVNLDPSVYKGTLLEDLYENPGSGVLLPKDVYDMNKGVQYYDPKRGAIAGMTTIDGQNVYLLEGYTDRNQEYFTAEKNEKGNYTGGAMLRTVTPGKSKFGKLGQIASGIAKTFAGIPLLPEIAATVIPGAGPALYGSLKALQTAGKGGDLGDVVKSGVLSAGAAALPGVLKTNLPAAVTNIPGAVPAIAGTTTGLLTGKPVEEALKTGLASGVGSVVGGEVASTVSPSVGTKVGSALGTVAGGTTAGLLGGQSAAESAIASTIGAGANLAGQAASNLVNRNLFSGVSETGVGKMDDFSNGGIQIFDDGSSIFFDNSGNVVGGIDNSGSQFNAPGFDLQIFDDGTFLAKDATGNFSFSTTDAPLFTGGLTVGSIGGGLASNAPPTLSSTLGKVASQAASSGARSLLSKLLGGASSAINSALGANTSEQQIATLLQGLLNRGINYETAERVANDFRKEGQALQTAATQAGAQAAVPFTPYTVTSGFGTGTVGPTGATSTTAPEYAGIREQALGQAAQTLGAINPAQASQTLFGQLEGLAGPARQREQEQLLSRLGASGLLGIGRNLPTVGGGIAGVNPYIESLLSAQGTQQAQNALAATQFGTQEAQRQQALSQSLLGMGTGLDAIGLEQLSQAGNLGQLPLSAQQLNAQRQLEATLTGLRSSVPFSTTAANIQMGQTGLVGQTVQDLVSEIFRGR